MKLIKASIILLIIALSSIAVNSSKVEEIDSNSSIIMPKKSQKYRTAWVFNENKENDSFFTFYPFLSQFVSYAGWYRKADSNKSEIENLKDQIAGLKEKLFVDGANMKEVVNNKEVHNEKWLKKQMKIARILELEDLLKKDL